MRRCTRFHTGAGTPTCGASLTPGSLTAASYTQTYTYDTLDRLRSGPLGSYTYGDTAHLHAVTSIATGGTTAYSASYDAGGNMTCRAATSSTTCAGTPTGAQLTFDNEGRLAAWQNTPSSPTSSDSFLYDGEGNRVEQQSTTNGSIITSTVYVAGGLEEITSTGATTTLTKYFGAQGLPTAERVGTNGPLAYLATDGQGTVSESLDSTGNVTSAQLYTPYGSVRYSSGSSPTSMGYTGQRADSATGLDYYHARYYDPVAGQFISADTVDDGLNRYGYVAGNPTTATDPTGHRLDSGADGGSSTPLDCHVTYSCPPPPPTGCQANHSCKGGGKGSGCPGSADCSPSTPGSRDGGRDKAGKCTAYATCDSDKATAYSALRRQADKDSWIGKAMIVVFEVIEIASDIAGSDVARTLKDVAEFLAGWDDYVVPAANGLFGPDSGIATFAEHEVQAANQLLSIIHGFYGLLFLAGAIITAISAFAEGPLSLLKEAFSLALGGLLQLGVAYGFHLVNQSIDEQDEADKIGGETTPQWCEDNPGACDWNGKS